MIELPAFSDLAAAFADPRFIAAVAVAVLAGVVRGFSGFGSALIYVPLIAAIYEPRIATVSFVLMDYICVAPFAIRAFPQCSFREIAPALIAAVIAVPFGTRMQYAVDPVYLRWAMALFVLAFVVILMSGWRYRWKPNPFAAMGAGAMSGFAGGATQISGPPVILYWLGSPSGAAIVRANLLVFLVLLGFTLMVNYALHGLVTAKPIALAALLWPTYIVALIVGARWFRGSSDQLYRRIAYVIVALTAIVSMPLFDGMLR